LWTKALSQLWPRANPQAFSFLLPASAAFNAVLPPGCAFQ
jgi:hypothetical protein